MRHITGFLAAAVLAGSVLIGPAAPASAAEPGPYIGGFGIEYAPRGKNGAIVLPWMGCDGTGGNVATIVNTRTGKTVRRSWNFGMSSVSVPPATYSVTIAASCNGASSTYRGTRTVKREADNNTVTKAEFKRLKKGMSLKQIKRITGSSGLAFGSTRLLDHRGSFGWAELSIKKGKLAGKWWTAELGDSSVR